MEIVEPPSEDERVQAWRLHVLLQAGYLIDDAELIAARADIDLRGAVSLLERGCPLALAALILL